MSESELEHTTKDGVESIIFIFSPRKSCTLGDNGSLNHSLITHNHCIKDIISLLILSLHFLLILPDLHRLSGTSELASNIKLSRL